MKLRPYVLYSWFAPAVRIVESTRKPSRVMHPHYVAFGPFRTMRAAEYFARNPHCVTVEDAEQPASACSHQFSDGHASG